MKKVIFSFLAVIAMMVYVSNSQPKIEIQGGTDTYDWKTVTPKDDPLKANVTIKNVGNEKLIINEVKAGCGCTTARLDEIKANLEPGESTTLPVTLRLGATQGDLTKTVRVSSNDPAAKDKMLYLKAKVFHPISITPTYFTFNEMKVGSEVTSSVKIKNNTDKNVTLSNFEITPDNVIVNYNMKSTKVLKPNDEIEVTAKYKADKVGYFNCTLKVKTTSTDVPELVVSGYGQVKESPIFNSADPAKK